MTHTERVARLAQESAELRRLADTAVRRARAAADEARHLRDTVWPGPVSTSPHADGGLEDHK